METTQAYYDSATITAVKSFISSAPGEEVESEKSLSNAKREARDEAERLGGISSRSKIQKIES